MLRTSCPRIGVGVLQCERKFVAMPSGVTHVELACLGGEGLLFLFLGHGLSEWWSLIRGWWWLLRNLLVPSLRVPAVYQIGEVLINLILWQLILRFLASRAGIDECSDILLLFTISLWYDTRISGFHQLILNYSYLLPCVLSASFLSCEHLCRTVGGISLPHHLGLLLFPDCILAYQST